MQNSDRGRGGSWPLGPTGKFFWPEREKKLDYPGLSFCVSAPGRQTFAHPPSGLNPAWVVEMLDQSLHFSSTTRAMHPEVELVSVNTTDEIALDRIPFLKAGRGSCSNLFAKEN